MKRVFTLLIVSVTILVMQACKDKGKAETKETPASIAQAWCELNGKYSRAPEGAEKDAAKAARKKFEEDMEAKYKKDEAFMDEIEKEVEKCEDASEGK